jgi:RNA-directed DNA polymerase
LSDEFAARRAEVASGLALAMLAGPWDRGAMTSRCHTALGRPRAPRWLDDLVGQVLEVFRQPPHGASRELAAYLQVCLAWEKAWAHRRVPRIVSWTPSTTRMAPSIWPVTPLPDLGALGRLLDVDQGELAWFADVRGIDRTASMPLRHYRWTLLRKSHGVRLVAAPKPRLREIQRRLLRHVFAPIPLHPAAHGCVPGRSVRTALDPHADREMVVRLDIASFFASIAAGRIFELLRGAGYPEAVAHTITGLVTTVVPRSLARALDGSLDERGAQLLRRPHLPQGAPTSPAAANAVAFSLDRRLAGLADRFGSRYTRYVDDLVFSGGASLRRSRARLVSRVCEIVVDEGFRINNRKTVALGAGGRQALFGSVINTRPTLPREQRDELRAILHNCAAHGWRSEQRDVPDFRAHLLGRVAWAAGLDPVFGARVRAAFDEIDWS